MKMNCQSHSNLPEKTAGRSNDLPVPDGTIKCPGYPSSLTAAEMSSTNAPIGTQSFTQNMVLRSLFCATISTEIDENGCFIVEPPVVHTGSAVGAVGPLPYLRGQNAHPHGVSPRIFQFLDPRQKPVLASVQPRSQQRLECNLRRPTKATAITPYRLFYLTVNFIQDKSASLTLLKLPRKTAGRSNDLPVPDDTLKCPGYPSSLTAAEMSSTNAPIGTQSFTQNMVLRSLFCATISTEIDEDRGFIATSIITPAQLLLQLGRCLICGGKMRTRTAFHQESFNSQIPARNLFWLRSNRNHSDLMHSLEADKSDRHHSVPPILSHVMRYSDNKGKSNHEY